MADTLVGVKEPPAAAGREQNLGLRGDDDHAVRRVPARERRVMYGQADCPYGWVCVAEQHGHDLGPLALIDVYGLPEDDGS